MAECKENVGKGIISFPCYLEPDHDGPHVSRENIPSQHARRAWEAAMALEASTDVLEPGELQSRRQVPHPGAEDLSAFQGRPRTSQTGLMESGAPPEERSIAPLSTVDTSHGAPSGPVRSRPAPSPTHRPETVWADARQATHQIPAASCTVCGIEDHSAVWKHAEPADDGVSSFGPGPAVPTKQREGDQPLPVVNDSRFVQDLVIEDIETRKAVGIERYGTPLQVFNGRNVDLDLYEEILDAAQYLKQKIVERAELADTVVSLFRRLESLYGSELPQDVYDYLEKIYLGLKVDD